MEDRGLKKCKSILELFIFGFIFGTFIAASLTTYFSINSDYVANQYKKVWSMNYILDITAVEGNECPFGYHRKILGEWSGFNGGCYCINNSTRTQIATDKNCTDKLRDLFYCHDLPRTPPKDLVKFKKYTFCIKRSHHDYFSLFDTFKGKINSFPMRPGGKYKNKTYEEKQKRNIFSINENQKTRVRSKAYYYKDYFKEKRSDLEYDEYLKLIMMKNPFGKVISDYSIVDIKMLNPKLFNPTEVNKWYYNLTNYEEKKISDDFSIFILRAKNLNRKLNIFDIQNVLVDVRYFNQLWCSYLDLSSTYEFSKFTKETYNYGQISYCEDFYKKNKYLSYNDKYVNTLKMSFDFDYTKSIRDVYDHNEVTAFYQRMYTDHHSKDPRILKNSKYNDFEPTLVAQKYFWGMGCLYSEEPREHIEKLHILSKVFKVSSFLDFILSYLILILLIFICSITGDWYACKRFLVVHMFVLTFICFVISGATGMKIRSTLHYFRNYMLYCQTDFNNNFDNNAQKTTPQEIKFYEDLEIVYKLNGITAFGLFLSFLTVMWYMIFVFTAPKIRPNQDNQNMPNNPNQPVEIKNIQDQNKNNQHVEYNNNMGIPNNSISINQPNPPEIEINVMNLDSDHSSKKDKLDQSGFPDSDDQQSKNLEGNKYDFFREEKSSRGGNNQSNVPYSDRSNNNFK